MIEIWWVEDFLSGETLENQYYPTQEEAVAARERLGYGFVTSSERKKGRSPHNAEIGPEELTMTPRG